MSRERALPHVREFLGQRMQAFRKERGFSLERLGNQSSLSGKFIGEVERGHKSISIDSLYRVSIALAIPLGYLADVPRSRRAPMPSRDAERVFALVTGPYPRVQVRKAYEMVRVMFGET